MDGARRMDPPVPEAAGEDGHTAGPAPAGNGGRRGRLIGEHSRQTPALPRRPGYASEAAPAPGERPLPGGGAVFVRVGLSMAEWWSRRSRRAKENPYPGEAK